MATYAIGDIQGCFEPFLRLLDALNYRQGEDQLWLLGDLVNRGPHSLEVLRWAHEHEANAVLGNHDLHLLNAVEAGPRPKDTFADVLAAPDADVLLGWLRRRPLIHRLGDFILVHAGIPPQWSIEEALTLGQEASQVLQGPTFQALLEQHRDGSDSWTKDLSAQRRWATIVRGLTRLRCVDEDGRWDDSYAGPPDECPEGLFPWWEERLDDDDLHILFGHWAAAGVCHGATFTALDSGCVWGRELSAIRLEDMEIFSVPAQP